jgi:hypothetical protein
LACVSCGGETKVGALMCKRCLEGIIDPTGLMPRAQDPGADARLQQTGSISLRIGPVSGPDFSWGGGVEPALRLRSLLERSDKTDLPSFVEEYLAGAGIGLHVWGYERLPRRALVWKLVEECEELELRSELWARASVRMGNLHSLTILAATELPVDEPWLSDFVQERSKAALKLYSRAEPFPGVNRVARSNEATLYAWLGRSEDALRVLDELLGERTDEESAHINLKKAMVLCGSGRRAEGLGLLSTISLELADLPAKHFRAELEGKR